MQHIGVQGVGLQPPQALYPNQVNSRPGVIAAGTVSLAPGANALIPSGEYLVAPGQFSIVQVLDPVSGLWRPFDASAANIPVIVNSDGENYRVYNPLGFPVTAILTNAGTGYTSAPTVAATPGGSTWTAVVGGGVSAINLTSGGGSGFSVPPVVSIAPPPAPGVQATAVAAISGGAITSFTMINNGAGYGTSAPSVVVVPQVNDLTLGSIRIPAATTQLSYVGQVTAVLLTNEGNNPLAVSPALSFTGGGGSSAAATVVMVNTIVSVTASTAGSGYTVTPTLQTFGGSIANLTSGVTPSAAAQNPTISTAMVVPRQAQIAGSLIGSSVSGVGVVASGNANPFIDSGVFTAIPSMVAVPAPIWTAVGSSSSVPVGAVLAPVLGSVNDTVWLQPL